MSVFLLSLIINVFTSLVFFFSVAVSLSVFSFSLLSLGSVVILICVNVL